MADGYRRVRFPLPFPTHDHEPSTIRIEGDEDHPSSGETDDGVKRQAGRYGRQRSAASLGCFARGSARVETRVGLGAHCQGGVHRRRGLTPPQRHVNAMRSLTHREFAEQRKRPIVPQATAADDLLGEHAVVDRHTQGVTRFHPSTDDALPHVFRDLGELRGRRSTALFDPLRARTPGEPQLGIAHPSVRDGRSRRRNQQRQRDDGSRDRTKPTRRGHAASSSSGTDSQRSSRDRSSTASAGGGANVARCCVNAS